MQSNILLLSPLFGQFLPHYHPSTFSNTSYGLLLLCFLLLSCVSLAGHGIRSSFFPSILYPLLSFRLRALHSSSVCPRPFRLVPLRFYPSGFTLTFSLILILSFFLLLPRGHFAFFFSLRPRPLSTHSPGRSSRRFSTYHRVVDTRLHFRLKHTKNAHLGRWRSRSRGSLAMGRNASDEILKKLEGRM